MLVTTGLMNRFGELEITDGGKTERIPCYCCGHCSDVVLMRSDRTRERKKCYTCGKLLCERKEICMTHCTPIHSLARDHFETKNPEFKKYANAVLEGIETTEDAHKHGWILT